MSDVKSRLREEYLEKAIIPASSDHPERVRCVSCGTIYNFGSTCCFKCDHTLLRENASAEKLSNFELHERLLRIENEYRLARIGLHWGEAITDLCLMASMGTLWGVALSIAVFTGTQVIITYGIMALALVLYFSFVFGRTTTLKAEIKKAKKELAIRTGETVR